jgi:calcineurin-like phosphoesterase family protein
MTENFDEENGKGHRVINISGHTHRKEKFYNNNRSIYNVALDAHDCRPVELEQILKDIRHKGQN